MSDPCQLYLITPPKIDDLVAFADALSRALGAGNVACVQLRLKLADGTAASDADVLTAAEALLPVATEYDAAFLVNDRPDLAVRAGADGVHIGQKDAPIKKARAILGDDATIGVTCHASRHLAMEAGEAGADYVAFGAFFPTQTKETTARPEPELIEWWRCATIIPSVAIGGITPENCEPLVDAGADFLAVSAAVWTDDDGPDKAVQKFNKAIAAGRRE